MAQTSSTAYFEQLISLNTRDCVGTWVRGPFLEGYVTSAGSGSETVLRASREAFTAHTNTLELWKLEMLCTHIVGIIREHPSDERLTLPTLEFVAFLCDTGILHRLTNEDFG